LAISVISRQRKSKFVRLFDKTPPGVVCPHFYELVLSNGCPYDCSYCYLKLTFRGHMSPTLFVNDWLQVQRELDAVPQGVFVTGELADSLAIEPPLLGPALDYFCRQQDRYLLLLTKSVHIQPLLCREPSDNIIVSFSINSEAAAKLYEHAAPPPRQRLEAAFQLKQNGWRIRVRLDPVLLETGLYHYQPICNEIRKLAPEMTTVGSLRYFPGLRHFARELPRANVVRAHDGRMRYPVSVRVRAYSQIASWLGFQPSLCKETEDVWRQLGWDFSGCNCTDGVNANGNMPGL